MTKENSIVYSSLDEFLESDELKLYKDNIQSIEKKKGLLEEEEFDLDSINYLETITYPLSWGIEGLDKALGGQPTGKFMMLYGGAGSGKTTLTFQMAIKNQSLGNNVCYLSFEMPKKDFIIQNMRSRAGLSKVGVGEHVLPTPSQQSKMKEFVNSIRDLDIKGFVRQPSLQEFKDILESLKGEGYHQIIIDNMGMIGRTDGKDELKLYGEISSIIKDFCDSSGVSVILLHHTNKGSESSNGKRGFGAFRGNGKVADDCDYVVQLQREYLEDGGTKPSIKIEKDRISGKNGYVCDLIFEGGKFFSDTF